MQVTQNNTNKFTLVFSRLKNFLTIGMPLAWWPVIAALLVNVEVLSNDFLLGDYIHLYNVSNLPFIDAIRVPFGGHLLHSFTTVVWLLKSLFGVNPFVFLFLALILHLASVRLLFEIITRLTAKESLAAFGATLWGMSPFAIRNLGWISVHGHVYATAAILWVLLDIVRYSQTPALLNNRLLVRHALLLLVATTSFGVGLAFTLVFALVIALWKPLPSRHTRLVAVYASVALVAITLYVTTMLLQHDASDNLDNKVDFINQGLDNISGTLNSFGKILSVGSSGLVLGPLLIGKISLVPKESLVSVATIVALVAILPFLVLGCIVSSPIERRRVFALLLLPCAAYGMIAVARVGGYMPSPASTPRYHYLVPAVMAIIFCLNISVLIDRLPTRVLSYGRTSYFIWLLLVIPLFSMGTIAKSESKFLRQKMQYKQSLQTIETAVEGSAGQDAIYIANKPFRVSIYGYTNQQFPGLAALFVMNYPSNTVDGKQVFFLEESEEVVQMTKAQQGTRISELLIHTPQGDK